MDYKEYIESLYKVAKFVTRNVSIDKDTFIALVNEAYYDIFTSVNPLWVWRQYERIDTDLDGSIYKPTGNILEDEYTILNNMFAVDENNDRVYNLDLVCNGYKCDLQCEKISVLQSVMYPIESCDMSLLMKIRSAIIAYVKMMAFEATAGTKGSDRQTIATNIYNTEIGRLKDRVPEYKWVHDTICDAVGVEFKL